MAIDPTSPRTTRRVIIAGCATAFVALATDITRTRILQRLQEDSPVSYILDDRGMFRQHYDGTWEIWNKQDRQWVPCMDPLSGPRRSYAL